MSFSPLTPPQTITILYEGPIQAKQRPRVGAHGRIYTPTATRSFENNLAWVAQAAMVKASAKPFTKPLKVKLRFDLQTNRSDLDNLCKSTLDALNGIVWDDDLPGPVCIW